MNFVTKIGFAKSNVNRLKMTDGWEKGDGLSTDVMGEFDV